MFRRKPMLAAWFSVMLLHAATSVAQTNERTQHTLQPSNVAVTQPADTTIDVIYTGKLLGYFRVPSLQKLEAFKGCHPSSNEDSAAARAFLQRRNNHRDILLVGTGDNFSPQFCANLEQNVAVRTYTN